MQTLTLAQLESELLARPLAERAMLAEKLLATLDPPEEVHKAAWLNVLQARQAAYLKGEVAMLSERELFDKIASTSLHDGSGTSTGVR